MNTSLPPSPSSRRDSEVSVDREDRRPLASKERSKFNHGEDRSMFRRYPYFNMRAYMKTTSVASQVGQFSRSLSRSFSGERKN